MTTAEAIATVKRIISEDPAELGSNPRGRLRIASGAH
jgi:hypothetical protein